MKLLKPKANQDFFKSLETKEEQSFHKTLYEQTSYYMNHIGDMIRQVNRKPYLTILHMQIVLIHHSKYMKSKIQTHRLIDNHVCAIEIEKKLG